MNDLNFTWNAGLQADHHNPDDSMVISGELVNASVCANNFAIDLKEFPKIVEQIPNATLRLDHSKSARDVIGGLKHGEYDEVNKRILFEAEVDDPQIQRMISKGRLKYISIGASADAFCSICDKSSKPVKLCKCKGSHDVIRNIKLKEASIITEPAYTTSEFHPVSFLASLGNALNEFENVATDSSVKEEGGEQNKNKNEEKKMSEEKKEEVKATTLKPAGSDAVVLLAEKLEGIIKRMESMEAKQKKDDEDEERKKKEEAEKAKKEEEQTKIKKQEETFTKLENLITKFDEAFKPKPKKEDDEDESKKKEGGIPKDVPKSKFEKKPFPPEEEDEDEKKPPKEVKKEAVQATKVESPEGSTIDVNAASPTKWWEEIKAAAQKAGILD